MYIAPHMQSQALFHFQFLEKWSYLSEECLFAPCPITIASIDRALGLSWGIVTADFRSVGNEHVVAGPCTFTLLVENQVLSRIRNRYGLELRKKKKKGRSQVLKLQIVTTIAVYFWRSYLERRQH